MARVNSPWGTIDRLPSGNYRLRGYHEGRERTVGTYPELAEALGAARKMAGALVGRSRGMTVNGWGKKWLKLRTRAGRHRGVEETRKVWDRYITKSQLGGMLLRDVRPKHVARWLHDLALQSNGRGGTLGHSTLANARTALSAALRDAVTAGHRDTNPAIGVVLPRRQASTEEPWTFLRSPELEELLTHPEFTSKRGWRPRRVFTIAIFTGLRSGELWGLRWSDVHVKDTDEPRIIVRYGNAQGGPTKSGRPRVVPLLPPARAALLELREAGGVIRTGPRHVFLGRGDVPHGKGYDSGWAGSWHRPAKGPNKGTRVWRNGWRGRCGMRPGVTFHDLRHTFASHLVMGSWGRAWRLEEVREVLGHTEIATTERYAHLAAEGLRRSVEEAERMWCGPDLNATRRATRPIPLLSK